LQRIHRKGIKQPIELAKFLGDFLERQGMAGKVKYLLHGDPGRDIGLAKSMKLLAPLCAARIDLGKPRRPARGVRTRPARRADELGLILKPG
jgi:hypothetical protein